MNSQNKKHIVLIGGGVGSLAGVIFEKKFIENIKSIKNKEISANTVHVNMPTLISDRTDYLFGKEKRNPAIDMFNILQEYIDILLKLNFGKIILAIPCNTFQHPKIKSVFEKLILDKYKNSSVVFVATTDSIYRYLQTIKNEDFDKKTVAVLGTRATMQLKIYEEIVRNAGFNYLDTAHFAEDIHEIIYNKKYGLKYTDKANETVIDKINAVLNELSAQHADYILFACTELSILMENSGFHKKTLEEILDKIIDSNHVYANDIAEIYQQL